MLCCAGVQVFSNDQQLAFELQGSSFKLVVGTLQVRCMHAGYLRNQFAA